MDFYVRMIGDNRNAGGSDRWLKIRSIENVSDVVYDIGVRIKGKDGWIRLDKKLTKNLIFKKEDGQICSFNDLLEDYYGAKTNRSNCSKM